MGPAETRGLSVVEYPPPGRSCIVARLFVDLKPLRVVLPRRTFAEWEWAALACAARGDVGGTQRPRRRYVPRRRGRPGR
jgi:hypothetical protein